MEEIPIPKVTLVKGWRVDCPDGKCGTIGFHEKREDAVREQTRHEELHSEHEKSICEKVADVLEVNADPDKPLPDVHLTCPGRGCGVMIGRPHTKVCDVAQCLSTGAQRAFREHVPPLPTGEGDIDDPHHTCGESLWTGYYPGEKEAAEYGVPVMVLKALGRWDQATARWTMDEGWEQRMQEQGLGPAISNL